MNFGEITLIKRIKIGTRGSKLALKQAHIVEEKIKETYPCLETEILVIKTLGDLKTEAPLDKLDRKGIFTEEIEGALIKRKIDLAVHSLKDMPAFTGDRFTFPVSLERAASNDCLILKDGISLSDLKKKDSVKIATGSKRRMLELKNIFKNPIFVNIRGNIDTRLNKLDEGDFDCLVLARAGLDRLEIKNRNIVDLDPEEFLPTPCQGMIGIETLKENTRINFILEKVGSAKDKFSMELERSFLKALNGGCQLPMGFFHKELDGKIKMIGLYGNSDLTRHSKIEMTVSEEDAFEAVKKLASQLKENVGATNG